MTEQTVNFEKLNGVPRLLIEADLKPIQGDRFQPTGFPDLGAAVYDSPNGKRMILVESAQSVANRLEQTCIDGSGLHIIDELKGIPYLVANIKGEKEMNFDIKTSSLIEAHRINSPYFIKDKEFKKNFMEKAQYTTKGVPNWSSIAKALVFYDPNSLLHGVFMSNLEGGRMKLQRALSGFIEAENVEIVSSGGVKNDVVDPKGEIVFDTKAVKENPNEKDEDKTHYGNVPYHRTEYTADRITAYFNFDLALLNGYNLDKKVKNLLIALGLYKIRRFLDFGLRLRTACDLRVNGEIKVIAPKKDIDLRELTPAKEGISGSSSSDCKEFIIPTEKELLEFIRKMIGECKESGFFANPPVTVLNPPVTIKKKGNVDENSDESETTE